MEQNMYSGDVIDSHHHLWDLNLDKHPWLREGDASVQALGELSSIRSDYLVADIVSDYQSSTSRIAGSIHVEALWERDDLTGEIAWLDTLDKKLGIAARYVGKADFSAPNVESRIDHLGNNPRVAGLRSILSWHPDQSLSFCPDPELSRDRTWRQGVALLEQHSLHLELMMYPYQAEQVYRLALDFPDLFIVINHCGSPIDRDIEGMSRWRAGLRRMSQAPNILLKVTNPGAYDPLFTEDSICEVISTCIETFGYRRTMFGTDFPVSKLTMSPSRYFGVFRSALETANQYDQECFFYHTAASTYRLPARGLAEAAPKSDASSDRQGQ